MHANSRCAVTYDLTTRPGKVQRRPDALLPDACRPTRIIILSPATAQHRSLPEGVPLISVGHALILA